MDHVSASLFWILPEGASDPGIQMGRKREGASTVSLNHPLAANS